ncbi:hypothetical protein BCR44DRAFT_59879 [Catenaria anguillulae PL171]|uniref:Uncharacterized protein n=1 Tax=Catenaria anguillulae PL171 TaxID=765915 RepID=A0A1Y2HQV3_9FUNG|nr:hypothetical protein BCR44DRAFT_59879 [Catenaria anguillulae PL171]
MARSSMHPFCSSGKASTRHSARPLLAVTDMRPSTASMAAYRLAFMGAKPWVPHVLSIATETEVNSARSDNQLDTPVEPSLSPSVLPRKRSAPMANQVLSGPKGDAVKELNDITKRRKMVDAEIQKEMEREEEMKHAFQSSGTSTMHHPA